MVVSYDLGLFFFVCMEILFISASGSPPDNSTFLTPLNQSFVKLFGYENFKFVDQNGKSIVQISLDQHTGCGFKSQENVTNALFQAEIKLPAAKSSAGVVVAFYATNGDVFNYTHDELDFEFLGAVGSKDWVVQTNVYGNGSITRGREERYKLWFDPTKEFHKYGIAWGQSYTVFTIDDVVIREVKGAKMGEDYPSKPMSLYATIWDGSDWATNGGKDRVNYNYAPFSAQYSSISIQDFKWYALPVGYVAKMEEYRAKRVTYSYCQDSGRYPTPLPECS